MLGNVLYHAVSSYQLLEVMLHRMTCHPKDRAVLILPDFIQDKYPWFRKLEKGFFDRVHLFPYLEIPHDREERIVRRVIRCWPIRQSAQPEDTDANSNSLCQCQSSQ